ncbi:unnamed protein product [Prorocentrum cordatum]|uniref:Peptidase A1 domain-containing protein n=1 Tax=Prorocentrum cordatum TaxID=2364126 RepID=A0ABN9VDL7_9DINO|nr:unnamed protein product [Polarella glacialis]
MCVLGFQRLRISRVRASGAQSPRSSERVAVTGFFGGGILLVNISLGSDAREVPVNIDLGSGPLWVPTTSATCCSVQGVCATCQAKGKPGHEFSAKPLTNFTSTYGVGNVTGAAYVEKVQVGDLPGFEIIMGGADLLYQFSGFFGSPMEGLMGLGLAYLNEGRTDPSVNIWEMSTVIMMWKQDVIDSPVFTLSLHGGDDDGELILGRVDSSQIDAEFFWTPVVKPISPDGHQTTPSRTCLDFGRSPSILLPLGTPGSTGRR